MYAIFLQWKKLKLILQKIVRLKTIVLVFILLFTTDAVLSKIFGWNYKELHFSLFWINALLVFYVSVGFAAHLAYTIEKRRRYYLIGWIVLLFVLSYSVGLLVLNRFPSWTVFLKILATSIVVTITSGIILLLLQLIKIRKAHVIFLFHKIRLHKKVFNINILLLVLLLAFAYYANTKIQTLNNRLEKIETRLGCPVKIGCNEKDTKSNNQLFDWLDLPVEYFSDKDIQWGSAGKGNSGKISDYTQVALGDKAVYQSYPTIVTTIKDYSNEMKPLKTKSFDEIMQEFSKLEPNGWGKTVVEENYRKYGSLATNYLPTDNIWTLEKFDVDSDGVAETIVSYNFTGAADAGSYRSDIIKGNNVIFSVEEDNSSIVPADTTNGFYVEWRSANDPAPRCCEEGIKRTRFVFRDDKFIPIYEQEVKYLKVGKE